MLRPTRARERPTAGASPAKRSGSRTLGPFRCYRAAARTMRRGSGSPSPARAVADSLVGRVAPQRLDGEPVAGIAGDVADRARDRLRRSGGGEQVLADPRALVAVLVGVEGVVPAAEVRWARADDILGPRIGDRLLDLVSGHDREAVELAAGVAVDGVLAAHVRAARVDRELVGDVAVRDPLLEAVVGIALDAGLGVVVERAVALRQRVRVAQAGWLHDDDVGVGEVGDPEVRDRGLRLLTQRRQRVSRPGGVAHRGLRQRVRVAVVDPDAGQLLARVGDVLLGPQESVWKYWVWTPAQAVPPICCTKSATYLPAPSGSHGIVALNEPSVIDSAVHVIPFGHAPVWPQPQYTRYSFGVTWTWPP